MQCVQIFNKKKLAGIMSKEQFKKPRKCHCVNLRNFCDNSTIHGFRDLYYSKSILWKIIWLLIIVGAVYISCFQLFQVVQNMIKEPTMTIIKPLSVDIEYPPLSFCYIHWIYWVNWSHVENLGLDKPTALYGMGFVTDIKSSTSFNSTDAKSSFLNVMKSNGFNKLTEYYVAIAMNQPPGFDIPGVKFKKRFNMYNHFFCYVISSKDVKTELSRRAIAGKHELKLLYYSNHFKLSHMYLNQEEYLKYMITNLQNIAAIDISSLNFNETVLSVSVSPKINVDNVDTSWITINDNSYETHVTIDSVLNLWLANRSPSCNSDEATSRHYNYCSVFCNWKEYLAQRQKECIQLTGGSVLDIDTIDKVCENDLLFMDTGEKIVRNQQSYKIPLTQLTQSYNSCLAMYCTMPCKHWKHTSTTNRVSIPSQFSHIPLRNLLTISYPSVTSVFEMIQAESQNWETIVGDIGGIVGLWLGASVLSFMQMIYLLCCSFCDRKLADLETKYRKNT